MAKKLILFALRLLMLNVVAVFIVAIFFMIENKIIQLCVDALFIFALWYFAWRDSVNIGLKDAQKDKIIKRRVETENYVPQGNEGKLFRPWLGFIAGLISQAPTLLLVIILVIANSESPLHNILTPVINIWNYNYFYIENSIPATFPYIYAIASLLFCAVSGLAYLNGPNELKRIETVIERNKAKKPRRVQDEWAAAKKKTQQPKKR